jgi:hypothetical protein
VLDVKNKKIPLTWASLSLSVRHKRKSFSPSDQPIISFKEWYHLSSLRIISSDALSHEQDGDGKGLRDPSRGGQYCHAVPARCRRNSALPRAKSTLSFE